MQGCVLRKIEGIPVPWTCKILGCPAYDLHENTKIFLVTQAQKLGAKGHRSLLEHSPDTILGNCPPTPPLSQH